VLTAGLSVSVRTQVRVAANVIESAKAEALADGGVTLAVMDILAARRSRGHRRRFPADGSAIGCTIGDNGMLIVSVTDAAARIDVNAAGIPLLQALLSGLGEPPEKAAQLAEAIFDFRDADDDRKPNGAESAEYRAAGLGWLPKNAPLQSIAELGQVYGVTPDLLARMRPYLSTHSGLPGVDATLASPALMALLRAGLEGTQSSYGSFPEFHATVPLPAMFVSASQQNTYTLRIAARSAGGAVFVREAVIDLGPRQSPRQVFLSWARGIDIQPTEEELFAARQISAC
jgi:general secretion pathway protein K